MRIRGEIPAVTKLPLFDRLQAGEVFRLANGHRYLMKVVAMGREFEPRNAVYLHSGNLATIEQFALIVPIDGEFVVGEK